MKSNLNENLAVMAMVLAIVLLFSVPPAAICLWFSWPYYMWEVVGFIWAMILLLPVASYLGVFK